MCCRLLGYLGKQFLCRAHSFNNTLEGLEDGNEAVHDRHHGFQPFVEFRVLNVLIKQFDDVEQGTIDRTKTTSQFLYTIDGRFLQLFLEVSKLFLSLSEVEYVLE